jgi:hypothetical protein
MKNKLIIVCALMFGFSQESVGFTEPSLFNLIPNFRIPTYETFVLDVYGNTSFLRFGDEYSIYDPYDEEPYYYYDRIQRTKFGSNVIAKKTYDSDEMNYSVFMNVGISNTEIPDDDFTNTYNQMSYDIEGEIMYYGDESNNSLFTYGYLKLNNINVERESSHNHSSFKETEKYETSASMYGFGVGLGKLRNINHVIRAIRFNERLKEVSGSGLTDSDIMIIAEEFAKYGAISSIFDRPKKEFWKNVHDRIDFGASTLEPYDLFYIDEVFREAIGQRKEGYRAIAKYIMSSEEDKGDSYHVKDEFSQIEFDLEFSRNQSLDFQFNTGVNFTKIMPEEAPNDYSYTLFTPNIGYLYTITDRLLWDLNTVYSSLNESFGDFENEQTILGVNSNLSYYVENTITLSLIFEYEEANRGDDLLYTDRIFRFNIKYGLFNTFN